MFTIWRKSLCLLLFPTLLSPVMAIAEPQDAAASDPNTMGWMQGFPPADERIIGYPASDYFSFPKLRWTFCHFREIQATRRVGRGLGPISPFSEALDPAIDDVTFTPIGGDTEMTWKASLDANYTDGMLILHRGEIVYEYYSGCLDREGRHGAMSVTKSFVGTIAEILIAEGELDESKLASDYVPELKPSAFGNATVREIMDMTTGLDYNEDYADPESDIWLYAAAGDPTIEFKITALVYDTDLIDRHIEIRRHALGHKIVQLVWDITTKPAAPRVELPVLHAYFAALLDKHRAVIAHPGAVIRNIVPSDQLVVRTAACFE